MSQNHAEIICRDDITTPTAGPTYFLRDFSRYGTLILLPDHSTGREASNNGSNAAGTTSLTRTEPRILGWQKVHHQEVPLQSGIQLKFGSPQGQTLEFVIEDFEPLS